MKKLPIILNIISLLAIAALFVLFFTSRSGMNNMSAADNSSGMSQSIDSAKGIVYVNIDTVLNSYDFYFDLQQRLQDKLKTSQAQLDTKQKSYQKDVQDFQYKVDRGLITRSDAAKLQQDLANQEQSLVQLQNDLRSQLADQQQVAYRQVLNSIMEYLTELQSVHRYKYVMGTSFGGNILYADKNLDITKSVIKGLNEKYKKEREKTK
jgi:outer membrane protein